MDGNEHVHRLVNARLRSAVGAAVQDCRHAARSLRRTPLAVAAATVTLAIAITAVLVVVPALESVTLNPLGLPDAHRLVLITEARSNGPAVVGGFASYGTYAELRTWADVFDSIGVIETTRRGRLMVMTGAGAPARVFASRVNKDYFAALGIPLVAGRTFTAAEDRPGGELAVILSEQIWTERFGRRTTVVGETITLNKRLHTIVGVAPRRAAQRPFASDVWVPLAGRDEWISQRGSLRFQILGRLRPSVTVAAARAAVGARYRDGLRRFPELSGFETRVEPLIDAVVGRARAPIVAVSIGALFVLLAACGNMAAILLARASSRQSEIAVRASLGASRRRLAGLFLWESAVVSVVAGSVSVLLGYWASWTVRSFAPVHLVQVTGDVTSGPMLALAGVLVALTAVICGLAPATLYARKDLFTLLKAPMAMVPAGARRLHAALVAAQISIGLVLCLAAVVIGQSFAAVVSRDAGVSRPDELLTFQTSILGTPECQCELLSKQADFYGRLVAMLSRLPGVRSAAVTSALPVVDDAARIEFHVEASPEQTMFPFAAVRGATGSYFATMGIPLLAGRTFGAEDRPKSEQVAIVNEAMAAHLGGPKAAVGRRFRFNPRGDSQEWIRVVGVVANVRHDGLESVVSPDVFLPHTQLPSSTVRVVIRAAGSPSALVTVVRTALTSFDAFIPVSDVQTMDAVLYDSTSPRRFALILMTVFAVMVIALMGTGVYGLQAVAVDAGKRDIGIAMALGATHATVLRAVFRKSLRVALTGLALGVAIYAMGVAGPIGELLFEVSYFKPSSVGMAITPILIVVALGTIGPARRASRVDPAVVLRLE